ncbi:MAG: NERD domain-containing protein, partial [Promethearchaeota archaeon]
MHSPQIIERFFLEVYHILKNVDRNVMDVWQQINEIPVLCKISNKIDLDHFLHEFNFIEIEDGNYTKNFYVSINKIQYICECMKYINLDIKKLSILLDYSGFEALIEEILSRHGFHVIKNFRFSDQSTFKSNTKQKRYEIDVIGIHDKYMLIIDAKQWKNKDSFNAINKAANHQLRRVIALKKNPQKLSSLIQELLGMNYKVKLPFIMIPMMITMED